MKILLIDPPFKRLTGLVNNYFPIGLGYLAAVAKNMGHEVNIYEVDAARKPTSLDFAGEYKRYDNYLKIVNDRDHSIWHEIKEQIKRLHPDLIGITSMTPKIASALVVADICKEINPDCPVVLGGAHPTVSPDQSIAYNSIDFIARGEGEITFSKLLKKINAGEKDFSDIPGLSYKEGGSIKHNSSSEFIKEPDEIPFPARDRLLNIKQYTSEDMGVILTSRGCAFRCTYCYHPWKGRMYFRSIENVLEEISQVMSDYETRQFAIKDDTFTIKREHVLKFCEGILRRNLKFNWDCTTRVDRVDAELLKLMIRAGCNVIKVGVETGSERILQATKKGITFEQVRNAAALFNKHNIFWSAYFMVGLPQETEEDIMKTYGFMREINPFYAGLGIYEPFRYTELFDQGVEMGLLYPEVDIDHFYKIRPKDYYFIDPKRRTKEIEPQRFEELTNFMIRAFDKHNKTFSKMIKRGWIRKRTYQSDPGLLIGDLKKAVNWVLNK